LDVPQYGPLSVVEITDVLHSGVVYLGKYIKGSVPDIKDLEEMDVEEKLVVKIIYSGIVFEQYGKAVHRHLETKDMAPKYFFSFQMNDDDLPGSDDLSCSDDLSNADVIESHIVMEYLPPPSSASAGWITLADFQGEFPQVASHWKADIETALHQILVALKEAKFVHGDLRPNNLMIKVASASEGCIVQLRPASDPPLPYLKVIDFDWAGEAGAVEYPPHRNPEVEWPGDSGKPILATHDKVMIDTWLSKWALDKASGGVRRENRRKEATRIPRPRLNRS
jgi:serine/threonine protein kinase